MPRQSWDKKPVHIKLDSKHAIWLIITLRNLRDRWEKDPRLEEMDDGGVILRNLRLCKETLADLEAAIEEL